MKPGNRPQGTVPIPAEVILGDKRRKRKKPLLMKRFFDCFVG
jgi:hypothetical protein